MFAFMKKMKTLLPTESTLPGRASADARAGEAFRQRPSRSRRRFPRACSSRSSAWAASGARSACSGKRPGVYSTAVGYAGGETKNPTYEEVCSGFTNHTEAVLVVFDPKIVTYEELLKVFWEAHDPTQGMRQGNDAGTQYRSAIYTYGDEQAKAAAQSKEMYRESAEGEGLRPDHDRDPAGAGVLLRRGLSPAVPRQESRAATAASAAPAFRVRREWRSARARSCPAAGFSRSARSAALAAAGARAAAPRPDRHPRPEPARDIAVRGERSAALSRELGYAEGARATFLYRYADGGFDLYRKQAQDLAAQRLRSADRGALRAAGAGAAVCAAGRADPVPGGGLRPARERHGEQSAESGPQYHRRVRAAERARRPAHRDPARAAAAGQPPDGVRRQLIPPTRSSGAQSRGRGEFSADAGAVHLRSPTTTTPTCRRSAAIDADAFMTLASPVFARDRQQIQEGLHAAAPARHRLPIRIAGGGGLPADASAATCRKSPGAWPRWACACWPAPSRRRFRWSWPTSSSWCINVGTARLLGVKIPDSVRARAARVIE